MGDTEPLLASRYDPAGDLFVICNEPMTVKVSNSDGSALGPIKKLIIDVNTPLNELVPVFQQVYFEGKEEFVFQLIRGDKAVWLNSLKTLKEHEIQLENDILVIFSISALMKNGALVMRDATRGGWLYKQSKGGDQSKQTFRIGNLGRQIRPSMSVFKDQSSVGGLNKKSRRYFVFKDIFLSYFDNPTDPNPKVVIPLNFQTIKLKKDVNNNWTLILERKFKNYFSKSGAPGKLFVLTADENEQNLIPQWYEALKEQCINTGVNRMFGASLDSVIFKRYKQTIPPLITKTIGYMDAQGLDVEGIFRLSGSSGDIEKWRDLFDQGEEVDLSSCRDPHTVASLLKQYLRELPEPILTFDMYDSYIAAVRDNPAEHRLPILLQLTSNLPEQYFTILKYLLSFLHRVNLMASINKMSLANLATCFGQNLLRPRDTSNPATIVEDSIHINQATQMLIEHEAKLYYKNPQVNERLEQTQKEIQSTEKSKVRHSLKMLHDELVQRQSLFRSETAVDSVKEEMWPEEDQVASPFEPLNDRNSFSHDIPVPPIETRKTLSKPLPPAPNAGHMMRRSKSYDSLVREEPESVYLPAIQPKQTLVSNPASSLSPRMSVMPKPLLHTGSYSPNSKRMSQAINPQRLNFEQMTLNNGQDGPVSMSAVNNNGNVNTSNPVPARPTPPPRNSVMFPQPPKFPTPTPKSPSQQPQQEQLPVAPPKANAKYRYSTLMPSSAVPLPGMPGVDNNIRRTTLTDQANSGQGPSLNGNTAGVNGVPPAPPKSPKPRASMMINPNALPGIAVPQPSAQNNHTAINSNASAANNSGPQSAPTFVMPRPVSISTAPQMNGEQQQGPSSPRQSPNASVVIPPVQNRPISMSVVNSKPTWTSHVLKEGLLTKKGEVRHNWKVRWFILTPASLYYFKSKQETVTPLGIVPLQDAEVMSFEGKRFSFFVKTPVRTYYIQTKSDYEQQDWMSAIIGTINKMRGADPQNLEQIQRETQMVTQQVEMNKANRRSAMISSEEMSNLNSNQ
eukprot:TRINITY_DN3934_c0_g1_i1.p1 TRINITY_DN3934_c0_g1~~TRINITY_DN3934_c0_g1_i1.p1  ORF type:complete len:1080 (-),score=157.73 TRINITY_DN3934_c0_g1_i1:82-3132(-)